MADVRCCYPSSGMSELTISIIIPVANEAALIRAFLIQLRDRAQGAELIVVDGGSTDGTAALAQELADQVVTGVRGRAAHMNLGARCSGSEVLWFLHVDSEVPPRCLDHIRLSLSDSRVSGGYFHVRLPRRGWIYRFQDTYGFYVGRLLRMRCGDHGIFCRRDLFFSLGGYPDVPLMEDAGFVRRLYRAGCVPALSPRILTSLRRIDQIGAYRYTAACVLIVVLYCFGISETFLARLYSRMVPSREALSENPKRLTRMEECK